MASILKAGRHMVLWSVGVGVALPLVTPIVFADDQKQCCKKIKPSQMPIYDKPEDLYDIEYQVSAPSQLQEGVSVVRKEVCTAVEATEQARHQLQHIYDTGRAHTAGQVAYLLDEENQAAKVGFVAASGVLGLLLGSRKKGGFFKKVFYTTAAVGASSAALYPQYSRELSGRVATDAATYASVAYNFVVGVKPQNGAAAQQDGGPTKKEPVASKALESEPSKEKSNDGNASSGDLKDDGKKKKSSKDVVVVTESKKGGGVTVQGDHGQSNPADVDMYTTRS